jgi:lipoprotein-releasing system permease protein
MPFALFLAFKYLKPRRSVASAVTLLAALGVALGVAIVIIVRAVMTGFGDTWREKILAFKPHITIRAESGTVRESEALCRTLESLPGVTAASPAIETRVLAEHRRRILAPVVVGVDPARVGRLLPSARVLAGRLDVAGDGVLLGEDLAAGLGALVGDRILLHSPRNVIRPDELKLPEELTVTGIFHAGQREIDGDLVVTSLGVARDLVGLRDGAFDIQVKTAAPQEARRFAAAVAGVRGALGQGFVVETWQEVDRQLFAALAVEKNLMVILLMGIVVVAIFCVTNTLIVITVQKRDEIGLLKALGFSPRHVLWTFVLYGWIQCAAGTLLGIGLAGLVLLNLQHLVAALGVCGLEVFPKSIYGLDRLPWRVVPEEVAVVAAAVFVFCSLASFLPAWRAARLDPVQALRKE